jgi:hypothetical protein
LGPRERDLGVSGSALRDHRRRTGRRLRGPPPRRPRPAPLRLHRGSPPTPLESWTTAPDGGYHRFDDCYLCTVNEPYYYDATPFWPDELQADESGYPHRIGIDPLAIGAVSLEAGRDLSASVIAAVRRSRLQGAQGVAVDPVGSPGLLGAASSSGPPRAEDEAETGGPLGQGRSVDPIRRRRVEERAVELARARYEHDGWTVDDVSRRNDETYGTPYDLRCSKDGETRHVEVKGTTGSGEYVRISANERRHAEAGSVDAQSFLFVLEQIGLKTAGGAVRAVGGTVRYDGPFLTRPERFTATQYRYVVPNHPQDDRAGEISAAAAETTELS